ncbi:MAG: efflux RND transporter periplasmic adaptor subunit [Deltaproteobacteria bacterium]|nr:efflux RND transporter periplasmic adaptor subunit [Deltaproteobacteria bacterium]
MKKIVLIIIGVAFLAFLGWRIISLISGSQESMMEGRGQAQTVAVETADAGLKPIKEIREFTGTVYPIYKYIIAPKTSGRVVEITKRIGDWVNKGEIIARLDNDEYQQAVLQAEANLKIAKASLNEAESQFELARQELERERSLQEKGIASSSELDTASTNYDAKKSGLELARAQVEQSEASLKSAQIRLNYTVLTSTEPGYIGERYVDEGNLLSTNSPLVSIIGIDTVIVQATIIEKDYGRIKVGQPAEIIVDAFPDTTFAGTVARIAPVLEEASRVAKVELEVNNSDRLLKPGMFARISVVLQEKALAQVVPNEALVKSSGREAVFIVEKDPVSGGNIARRYDVETGISTNTETEIISPEIKGPVVVLGQHLLQDGGSVTLSGGADASPSVAPAGESSEPNRGRGL